MTQATKPIGRTALMIVPADPGRKHNHLVMILHKGGGWYEATCMGQAKRCRAGTCSHVPELRWSDSERPIKRVARAERAS